MTREEIVDGIVDQEPSEDCISRSSIKHKLQEHHDFFVSAYGWFSNLPQNDKSRVDEITNCIAMVVNEPSVNLHRSGKWIYIGSSDVYGMKVVECSTCRKRIFGGGKFCSNCGSYNEGVEE